MPLVLVVLLGLIVEQRVLHGKAFQFGWNVGSGGGPIPLGRARPLLSLVVIFTALAVVGVPLGALIWRGMNVTALREALDRAGNSAIRSVAYAAVSATVVSILGFFLAYLIHRRAIAGWRWVDAATLFLFTVPGTVIGLGLIGLWNHPSTNWIYATPAMLVGGYIAQYAALGTRAMVAGFAQTPVHLEEAAEIAGATWFHRVRGILVPLLWPSILVGWAVSFLFCLRDVTLPLLLAPPGYDTLTARTMTLAANGSPELIAALCLLLIGLSMIPLGVCGAARRFWRAG
jgi:iron(III) transport system permease protein